jgi:hypothetical protein
MISYNAADERASFCVLDPFVSAPLFSLFCASNTGSLHFKLRSVFSIRRVSADTVVLFMPLFLICLLFVFYFISAHWQRFAAFAPCLR